MCSRDAATISIPNDFDVHNFAIVRQFTEYLRGMD
jgi:hypothetical protein